jgi:hypothetical protein
MDQLKEVFGEHTYFLAYNGVNIVEPFAPSDGAFLGKVVNVASWADQQRDQFGPAPARGYGAGD